MTDLLRTCEVTGKYGRDPGVRRESQVGELQGLFATCSLEWKATLIKQDRVCGILVG